MKELWYERKVPGDYGALADEYGVSPIVARLLANRGITGRDKVRAFLHGSADVIYNYENLPDIDRCVEILKTKTEEHLHIRVIGDYDVDGVCSTFILTKGLHKLGAEVDHAIPHRVTDGYGLNDRLIKEAADAGVDTVLTCDNGISAASAISLAHELGMTVIVTDHHEVPYHMLGDTRVEDIPDADAVVDIKRNDSEYGFTEICGAEVAFKVLTALYDKMGVQRSELDEFIEFAAFACIEDVMPLTDENRALVKLGLSRLTGTSNPGLKALIAGQGIEGKTIEPYHVEFVLGPCINATGRLDTADRAFDLISEEDPGRAAAGAESLIAMNNERKEMTERGVEAAMEQALSDEMLPDKVLVIYLPDTHESIAGIIAGRVRERTGRPVFILTPGENVIKGSGRSIDEYDMHKAMTEVSDLFLKFGGHKMAGGLSLREGISPGDLRRRINEICTLTEKDITPKVRFDMQLPFSYINMEMISDIEALSPFGVGNPKPLFAARDVLLRHVQVCGASRNTLRCDAVDQSGKALKAVYFGEADAFASYAAEHESLKILFSPEINEYKGNKSIQLKIRSYC